LGSVQVAPHLVVQNNKKHFWSVKCFSSQIREVKKRAYYRDYVVDTNQILHSDKGVAVYRVTAM